MSHESREPRKSKPYSEFLRRISLSLLFFPFLPPRRSIRSFFYYFRFFRYIGLASRMIGFGFNFISRSSFVVSISSFIFLESFTISHYDFEATRRQSYLLRYSRLIYIYFFLICFRSLNFGRQHGE